MTELLTPFHGFIPTTAFPDVVCDVGSFYWNSFECDRNLNILCTHRP